MAENAAWSITKIAGRSHGCARGQWRSIGWGWGQGKGARGGGRARVLMPFLMELSDQSDSSETEDDKKLTESCPGNPSKHLHSSNLSDSDMGDENEHESDLDDTGEGTLPRSHLNMSIPGDLRLSEGSTGRVGGAHPHHNVCMPAWFVQGKI